MHGALARAETDVFAFAGSEGKGCAHGGTAQMDNAYNGLCFFWN